MSAVGLTDHGTFAGAIDFLETCRREGVKPILGMEAYLSKCHTAHTTLEQPTGRQGNRHLNVIAKNYKGYQNVCALSQAASVDGFYYDPRLDFELLAKHSEGVIATSACLSNIVNNYLKVEKYEAAKRAAGLFKDIYGDDYYLEIMYHGIDDEFKILPEIQRLAKDVGVKMIVTNDCHYEKQEDAEMHEYVMCVSTGRTIKDPRRLKFPYKEFYFKSKEEMAKIFGHIPTAMRNTLEIAEKCDYSDIVLGGKMLLPKFELPEDYNDTYTYMHDMGWKGLKRLGLDKSEAHVDRLTTELDDIKLVLRTNNFDFATYFLIVEDIIDFTKKEEIAYGIRGSAYGSLLVKCLGIIESSIDPIKFGLLWERFLGFDNLCFLCEADMGIPAQKR